MLEILKEAIDNVDVETKKKAFSAAVNTLTQQAWDYIASVNSTAATFEYDYPEDNLENIKAIFESIVDELTICVGMLNKAQLLIDDSIEELVDKGEEKAAEIIDTEQPIE